MFPLVTLTENIKVDQKVQFGTGSLYMDQSDISHLPERPLVIHRNASDDTFNVDIPAQTNVKSEFYSESPYLNLNNKLEISGKSSIYEQVQKNRATVNDM